MIAIPLKENRSHRWMLEIRGEWVLIAFILRRDERRSRFWMLGFTSLIAREEEGKGLAPRSIWEAWMLSGY
jgi:hypothetical protein